MISVAREECLNLFVQCTYVCLHDHLTLWIPGSCWRDKYLRGWAVASQMQTPSRHTPSSRYWCYFICDVDGCQYNKYNISLIQHINWADVIARKLEPPFKPVLASDDDVRWVLISITPWLEYATVSLQPIWCQLHEANSCRLSLRGFSVRECQPCLPGIGRVCVFCFPVLLNYCHRCPQKIISCVSQGFTYVAPSVLDSMSDMQRSSEFRPRSVRRPRVGSLVRGASGSLQMAAGQVDQ